MTETKGVKIVTIGGGSSYTPELIGSLTPLCKDIFHISA